MDRIENSKVAEVFNNYPEDMRKKLMFLRQLTLETASEIEGINKLEETLIGESLFLRKLVLGIPAQASGKNLTRPLMPSAPQPSCVRATSPHDRKLGAGYVALPQMTGRRFGKPFILSPPTLALRFRQNNGPTPTGDYQPSRSLSMADSEWGEPSYLVKGGSTIRMDWKKANPEQYAMYFHCKTKLVDTFKELYQDVFKFEGNRAIIL